jgi:hypothetical protein
MKNLTQERLKELLSYNPDTGDFFWNVDKSGHAKKGQKASCATANTGYLRIGIDRKRYLAHRLVWLYVYGKFPDNDLDHINRTRTDNRLCNLREATRAENLQNRSNVKGVYWHKRAKKWLAQISVNKKHFYLGLHESFEDARQVYINAALQLHTHTAHIRSG